jgi:hypothetical protein
MPPGTAYTFQGTSNRTGGTEQHTEIFTVTDLLKTVAGVPSRVVYDLDTSDNIIEEAELSYFAQDNSGNVWNMGEYPETYDSGKFVGAPNTWFQGIKDANAGVLMLGNPRLGTPAYVEGSVPSLNFLDCGKVTKTGQKVCPPIGCYDNVLVVDEWNPLDKDNAHQLKHYATGVGVAYISSVDDPEAETMSLTKVEQLGPEALAAARQKALDLEKHAYDTSDVYKQTPPMQQQTP